MRSPLGFLVLAAAAFGATALDASSVDAARPRRRPRPEKAKVKFGAEAGHGAKGTIEVRRLPATKRLPEREQILLRMQKLQARATYGLVADDPFDAFAAFEPLVPAEVTTTRRRTAAVTYDSSKGGLPFGGTLDTLAGMRIRLEDAAGDLVLIGTVPALGGDD